MSRFDNFHKRFLSYDFATNAKTSGFSFTSYKERVEWDKLVLVDLDRVVRDVDIGILQEHVRTVVRCDLGELRGLDPGLVKLVRLAQLCLEYCLFCQEQLVLSQANLEQAHEQTLAELQTLRTEFKARKDDLRRRKKQLEREKENICSSPVYQCASCPKAFSSPVFLEGHVQRRHIQTTVNINNEVADSRLKAEVEVLKQQLEKEQEMHKQALQDAKESYLTREQAVWKQVEQAQAEQRARHQAELLDLTQTFQIQLKKQLTADQNNAFPSQTRVEIQEQMTALQKRLLQEKEAEVEVMKTQTEETWRTKLENLHAIHITEVEELREQLDQFRTNERHLRTLLDSQKRELETSKASQSAQFVPQPKIRHKKLKRRSVPEMSGDFLDKIISPTIIEDSDLTMKRISTPSVVSKRNLQPENSLKTFLATREEKCSTPEHGPILQPLETAPVTINSSSESSLSDESKKMDKMKDALQNNPEILQSLRSDVEAHVTLKLSEMGLDAEVTGLSEHEAARISSLTSHHRRLASKKFENFEYVREEVENLVQQRMQNQQTEVTVSQEPNLKPSKMKRSGLFAKLYKRKKSDKKTTEPTVYTSTPVREPHSILKTSKESLKADPDKPVVKSEPATPVISKPKNLQRTYSSQSLPTSKSVTFAKPEQVESPVTSWNQNESFSMEKAKQERPKSALQSSTLEMSRTSITKDSIHTTANAKSTGNNNYAPQGSDNSWDLEDL